MSLSGAFIATQSYGRTRKFLIHSGQELIFYKVFLLPYLIIILGIYQKRSLIVIHWHTYRSGLGPVIVLEADLLCLK